MNEGRRVTPEQFGNMTPRELRVLLADPRDLAHTWEGDKPSTTQAARWREINFGHDIDAVLRFLGYEGLLSGTQTR